MVIDDTKGINNLTPVQSMQVDLWAFSNIQHSPIKKQSKIPPLQHPEKLNTFSNSSKLSPILIIETKFSHMISRFPVSRFYPLIPSPTPAPLLVLPTAL